MTHAAATRQEFAEARELISRLCEEMLQREGQRRLENLMRAHRSIRLLYLELIQLHGALRQRAGSLFPSGADESGGRADMNDTMVLPALHLADDEDSETPAAPIKPAAPTAPTIAAVPAVATLSIIPAPPSVPPVEPPVGPGQAAVALRSTSGAAFSRPSRTQVRRSVLRYGLVAALLLSVAFAAVLLQRDHTPHARVSNAFDARFAGNELSAAGTPVPSGREINLTHGDVALTLDGGAQVVVEAPAVFSIDSGSTMTLLSGKLSAVASGLAHGFTVLTPTARVVDLGTEFCVSVTGPLETEVQVFRGKVLASPRSAAASNGAVPSETLLAGDAGTVYSNAVTRQPGGASAQAFVRSLAPVTSPIDLVDLVAGGDGTTHLRNGQIDPRNGHAGQFAGWGAGAEVAGTYHRIPSRSVFDGCFVPGKMTQVDSDGHRFNFPNSGRFAFYFITAAGIVDWRVQSEVFRNVLGGVDYSQLPHGFILMHSNCGLTIDLAALRRLHPGLGLSHLVAVVGNTYQVPTPNAAGASPKASAYVLVDGQPRFKRLKFMPQDGAIPIDLPVGNSDRFLTLVVTDGGLNRTHSWVIFGDPILK